MEKFDELKEELENVIDDVQIITEDIDMFLGCLINSLDMDKLTEYQKYLLSYICKKVNELGIKLNNWEE